jgi:hypothetical protein
VKNLAFWACGLGDAGLKAVTACVRAAANPWFAGSRLLSLEIVHDASDADPATWCV